MNRLGGADNLRILANSIGGNHYGSEAADKKALISNTEEGLYVDKKNSR